MTGHNVHLISAPEYNQIPHIDHQTVPSQAEILNVGKILVENGLHRSFGVHLLHRHYKLLPGTIVLNSSDSEGKKISEMTDIDSIDVEKLRATCFMLSDTEFVPLEYEEGHNTKIVPSSVLEDLVDCFASNALQRLLAIERIERTDDLEWREYMLHDTATFRAPLTNEKQDSNIGKATAWVFDACDGKVHSKIVCR